MKAMVFALVTLLSVPVLAQAEDAGTEQSGPDVEKLPFTPDSIRMVVEHHQPKIQGCYEQRLADKDKVFEGKIMTSFTITAEGLVKDAKVLRKGSTLRDAKLNDCVVAVLAAMSFPKPKKPQPIEYPFNLKAIK